MRDEGDPTYRDPELAFKKHMQPLIDAVRACGDDDDLLMRFLRDLCSLKEGQELGKRWKIATLLMQDISQKHIVDTMKVASSKVVGRVHKWTLGEFATGGFAQVYQRLVDMRQPLERASSAGGANPRSNGFES